MAAVEGYEGEPDRDARFTVNSKEPFNAEPPETDVTKQFVTPNNLFFVRNHAPVPLVGDNRYRLSVNGLVAHQLNLSLAELQTNYRHVTVMATLMCAGNRRTELHRMQPVRGVGWGKAAISNATWGGVMLRDVLLTAGLDAQARNLHVALEGLDHAKGGRYGGSIPIEKALSNEVLLAYEMNGQILPRDHGYPLRVVVPGYIGARSVKWLASITVQVEESSNFFQQKDYKLFLPQVSWDTVETLWNKTPALLEMNVQAAITHPTEGSVVARGQTCTVTGYAIAGGGRRIARVDVSVDGGTSWDEAMLVQDGAAGHWAWTLWRYQATRLPTPCQLVCRAWDTAYNGMPCDKQWNLRGVMNNSWNRVNILDSNSKL